MNKLFKYLSIFTLCFSLILIETSSVQAATDSTQKEEVIYIMLEDDGQVKEMYAVNIMEGPGSFRDYGDYSKIANLSTTDNLSYTDGRITGSTTNDHLYYQGNLKTKESPWLISIAYYLDNKQVAAKDLSGKSGKLKLKIAVNQNPNIDSSFFNSYTLQTVIKLNTNLAKNITCQDATVANVGDDKQLTYTILPGNNKNIEVTADINNFSMEAIAFNGVKLNLGINLNKEELLDKINQLVNGNNQINNGATALANASNQLNNGANQLYAGLETIETGLKDLAANSNTLTSGSEQIKEAIAKINASLQTVRANSDQISQLVAASTKLKTAITTLKKGSDLYANSFSSAKFNQLLQEKGLNINQLVASNNAAVVNLNKQIVVLKQQAAANPDQATALNQQIQTLSQIISLLNTNSQVLTAYKNSADTYIDTMMSQFGTINNNLSLLEQEVIKFDAAIKTLVNNLNELLVNLNTLQAAIATLNTKYTNFNQGLARYTNGLDQINSGFNQLLTGALALKTGTSSLASGSSSLASGTDEMAKQVTTASETIQEKLDSYTSLLDSSTNSVKSFVSSKNTHVTNLQFVIKGPSIAGKTKKTTAVKTKTKSFWQKLLALFK